jgi:type 1 fimbria pilin
MNNKSIAVKESKKTENKIHKIIGAGVLLLGMLGVSQEVQAAVTCKPSTTYPPMTINTNISISGSTAGEDIPVGQTLYRLGVGYSHMLGISCDGAFDIPITTRMINAPSGAPKTMTTDRGTGYVYPTNVPGVGVAMYTYYTSSGASALIGSSSTTLNQTLTKDSAGEKALGTYKGGHNLLSVMLVKTGPIASGSVVNASSFPSYVVEAHAMPGYSGLPIALLSGSYTGTSQFITQTCTSPANMDINLGSYEVAGFTAAGKTTKWIDSSIVLQNCPKFEGYYARSGTSAPATIDNGGPTGGSRIPNIFTISVNPANSVSGNIIAIDTGSNAATGVGVQLGYTPDDISASATAPSTIWTAGKTWNLTPPPAGGTVKIPLAARYYQTGSKITPGTANTKVIVNIAYK